MNSDFSSILLKWYGQNGRDLPWRHTRDPYAIWLSEVILQQTRIAQGTGYWQRLIGRFPSVEALAKASEDEVLLLWQGLGYYSRARNLHAAARQVVALGRFPDTAAGLKQLKGVGDYTAAAVASLAFGEDVAAVDGNVFRVLARVYGIEEPINTPRGKKVFAAMAQELLPRGHAAAYNQAMMDFGALQCTPKSPRCPACPLQEVCMARREGRVEALPVKLNKTKVQERRLTYIYIRCGGCTAIHRRSPGDIWQGLWEPLLLEKGSMPQWRGRLTLLAKAVRHQLTHRTLFVDFYLLETEERPPIPKDYIWIREEDFDHYAHPQIFEKIKNKLV